MERKHLLYFRTRHAENVFVAAVLLVPVYLSGGTPRDWVAFAAIFCTFKHAQISDRMREQEDARPVPGIDCPEWSTRFYVAKETLWILFFLLTGTYTAIVGSALFLAYPFWRRYYRRLRPLGRATR